MNPEEQLKQQLAQLQQQLAGLAAERNTYRDEAAAWKRLGEQAGELVQYDGNGRPVAWNVPQAQPQQPQMSQGAHPFQGLLDNPSAADQWAQAQAQQIVARQGFITQQQVNALVQQHAQQAMKQAYEAARQDAMLWRHHDQLVTKDPYKPLTDYTSDFSKSVAKILQEKQWGQPMNDQAKNFATDWRYRDMNALEWAADLARLEQSQQQQQGQQAAQSGQAAQQASGLSSQPTSNGAGSVGQPQMKELMDQGASADKVYAAMDALTARP